MQLSPSLAGKYLGSVGSDASGWRYPRASSRCSKPPPSRSSTYRGGGNSYSRTVVMVGSTEKERPFVGRGGQRFAHLQGVLDHAARSRVRGSWFCSLHTQASRAGSSTRSSTGGGDARRRHHSSLRKKVVRRPDCYPFGVVLELTGWRSPEWAYEAQSRGQGGLQGAGQTGCRVLVAIRLPLRAALASYQVASRRASSSRRCKKMTKK